MPWHFTTLADLQLSPLIQKQLAISSTSSLTWHHLQYISHWEIISRSNLLSWSKFCLIHLDLSWSTPDPSFSILTGSSSDLIQPKARVWISIQIWVFRLTLAGFQFLLKPTIWSSSLYKYSNLALIYTQASYLIYKNINKLFFSEVLSNICTLQTKFFFLLPSLIC